MPSWNLHLGNFHVDIPQVTKSEDGENVYEIHLSNQKVEMAVVIRRTSHQVKTLDDVMMETMTRLENKVKVPQLPKITGEETAEQLLIYLRCLIVYIGSDGCADAAEIFLMFADDDRVQSNSFYFSNKCSAMNELFRYQSKQLHCLEQIVTEDHVAIQDMNIRIGLIEDSNTLVPSRRESKASDMGAFVYDAIRKPDSRRNSYRSDGSLNTDTETNTSAAIEESAFTTSESGSGKFNARRRNSNNSDSELPSVILEETASLSSMEPGSAAAAAAAAGRKETSPKGSTKEMSFDSWVADKRESLKIDSGIYGSECLVAHNIRPYEHSEHLPISLVPRNVEKGIHDEVLDQILVLVKAQNCQTLYRNVVARYFIRSIRKVLGLRADMVDLSTIRCNLPDDPINISICMKTDMVSKWHSIMLPCLKKNIGTNSLVHSRDGGSGSGSPTGGANYGGVNGSYPTYATRMQGYHLAQGQGGALGSSPEINNSQAFRGQGNGSAHSDSGAETDFETLPDWKYAEFSISYATAHMIDVIEGTTRDDAGVGGLAQSAATMSVGLGLPGTMGPGPPAQDPYFNKVVGSVPGSSGGSPDEDALSKEEAYIQCGVDNLAVVIGANKNTSMSMVALLEQVSLLVGKDNLFKNSLLLIRAWWVYETAAYVGCNIRHYLSDDALSVMVIAIFNRYHTMLHQPLQALVVFLAEYSEMDWVNQAITVQGVVPFRAKSSPMVCPAVPVNTDDVDFPASYPWLMNPAKNHLLTPHWTQVFWGLSNVRGVSHVEPIVPTAVEAAAASVVNSAGSEAGADGKHGNSSPSAPGATSAGPVNCDIEEEGLRAYTYVPASETPEERIKHFSRCQVNIVNPLNHSNLFLSKGGGSSSPLMRSQRGVDRKRAYRRKRFLMKAFTTGAKKMAMALRLHESRGGLGAAREVSLSANLTLLGHFFNATSVRYSFGSRPDVFPGVYLDDEDDLDEMSFDFGGLDRLERDDGSYIGTPRARTASSQSDAPSVVDSELSVNSAHNSNSAPSSARASFISPGFTQSSQGAAVVSLWGIVQYHNLIVRKHLSGSALAMVVDEILDSRGALPVGEIGKMLQEFKIPSLSSKLKEVFGGLKKFLEVHSHRYFLGDDHQFNPHVILMRDIIAAGEQENIKHGINAEFVSRFKRTRTKRRSSNTLVHSDGTLGAPSLGRLAVANVAMDQYGSSRSLSTPPSSLNPPGSGRGRVKYGPGGDVPPPQGSIGVPEQYLDPPYGGANNVSIDHSKQYSRHQQPQGGSSRGPPGMHQQQMQGQQHTLRGHYGGLIHESGVSNSQEVLHGLSMPPPNSSGGAGARPSAPSYLPHQMQHQQQHQQQQYDVTPQHLDDFYSSNFGNLSAGVSQDAQFGRGLYGNQAEQMNANGMGWADTISAPARGLSNDNSQSRPKSDRFDDFSWQDN